MGVLYAVIIITVIGLVAGICLSLAAKFFAVPTDKKTEEIRACLPGANCGGCGFSGCDGYAAAIAAGQVSPDKCTAGGEDTAKALSAVLGADIKAVKKAAFVGCNKCADASVQFAYSGRKSCAAAALLYGGPLECKSGCIGFGDCAAVCEKNAITVDRSAKVDSRLCMSCGKCVTACPKELIVLKELARTYTVVCSNTQKGAVARKNCKSACIGCGKCKNTCEFGAVTVTNNLAEIDAQKCTGCGKCAEVCPDKCIVPLIADCRTAASAE